MDTLHFAYLVGGLNAFKNTTYDFTLLTIPLAEESFRLLLGLQIYVVNPGFLSFS